MLCGGGDSSCVSSCLNSVPSPCPSHTPTTPPPNSSSLFRHFASNANPLCSKWAVSAWNKRQLCPKLGRVSVSPGCLSQRGKGVSACSLALCPGSLEKPALFLDITHSRVWPALFTMPDANSWSFCCEISPKFLVLSCVFSCPPY